MKIWIRRIIDFLNETKDEHLSAFAGQSAFFIFLSIFPLLNLILMLATFLPYSQEELVETILKVIPDSLYDFVSDLINDICSNGTSTVTIIAIVAGLWSSSKGIMAIRNGLDEVCRSRKKQNYVVDRAVSAVYTGVFILLLFAITFINFFGQQLGDYFIKNYPDMAHLTNFLLSIKGVVSFLITFLSVLLLYTVLPSRKLLMRYQIVGALACSVAWMLMSWGFSIYISYAMKKSYMYGSISAIIMLMLWMYLVVNIILWCAQINQFLYLHFYKEKADSIVARKLEKRARRRARVMTRLHVGKKDKKEDEIKETEEKNDAEEAEEIKEAEREDEGKEEKA